MTTPDNITQLKPNEIFVFGSNLAGIHGAGAARTAHKLFGAEYMVGCGPTGQCYAIPTKDRNINSLGLPVIKIYVEKFIDYAAANMDKIFLVTKIGCGLAGYRPKQIAPMFISRTANVILPQVFIDNQIT